MKGYVNRRICADHDRRYPRRERTEIDPAFPSAQYHAYIFIDRAPV